MNTFDIGIVGAGVAGAFATFKLAKTHKNAKVIVFDIGRPPAKRRRQLEGWLGVLPNSDGKLYLSDLTKITEIVGSRRAKSAYNWFNKTIENIGSFKSIKDRPLSVSLSKKLKKAGFDIHLNDYVQLYPKDIHTLSKFMTEEMESNSNISFKFDTEVVDVRKQKNLFVVQTEEGEFFCHKLIMAVGRSGWRWASKLFDRLGITDNNDVSRFGIRVEINSASMKDFNRSNCTLIRDTLELGPLSWYGTVIPEDHIDVAISSYRSNENRWKSDKVSFNLISSQSFPGQGYQQTDRIGKLSFILSNDRIIREKLSAIIADRSKVSMIEEYHWLKDTLQDLSSIMPDIISKGYFHIPTIVPTTPKIILGNNLESNFDGLFVVGESAGMQGLLAAACTGIIAANEVVK